ncbi:MAG: T9SS type A sorting domain-containing protein [Chitinivibrionales bacterium]|nr:T9SS type A sorting domain-containing protein [Chitinivibrionales bacterium]
MLAGKSLCLANVGTHAAVSIYTVSGRPVGNMLRTGIDGTVRIPRLSAGAYIARIRNGARRREMQTVNFVVSN